MAQEKWGRGRRNLPRVIAAACLGLIASTGPLLQARPMVVPVAQPWRYQTRGPACLVTADFDGRPTTTVILARKMPRPAPVYLMILNPGRRIVPGGEEQLTIDVDGQKLGSFTAVMRVWGRGRGHEIALSDAVWQKMGSGHVLTITRGMRILERLDLANLAELKPRFDHCRAAS